MALLPVRKLLVEGADDRRVIPELIEQATGLRWGEAKEPKLVDIVVAAPVAARSAGHEGGVECLLEPGYIATEYKTARLAALGVVLDADDDPAGRWRRLRRSCGLPFAEELPEVLPEAGLVKTPPSGARFGVWLMPDNSQRGMLETFLLSLRPQSSDGSLWQWADEVVEQAQSRGAPFRASHRDKARCHTFLAWQDPPGRQLHQALKERQLDPQGEGGRAFVAWFRRLYSV
jgi:hypothetical protein